MATRPSHPILCLLLTSIKKLSDSCGKEWEVHFNCLEQHNQEFYKCRKPEKTLNQCVFEKLVGVEVLCSSQCAVLFAHAVSCSL